MQHLSGNNVKKNRYFYTKPSGMLFMGIGGIAYEKTRYT